MIGRGCAPMKKCAEQRGQMTVELCVVLPIVLALAAILVNVLTFFGECAEFDRVARNSVRLCASSLPEDTDAAAAVADITSMVSDEMHSDKVSCELTETSTTGYACYTLMYSYVPTLFGLPLRGSVFGVSMPEISHMIHMVIDPYHPGKWLSSGVV